MSGTNIFKLATNFSEEVITLQLHIFFFNFKPCQMQGRILRKTRRMGLLRTICLSITKPSFRDRLGEGREKEEGLTYIGHHLSISIYAFLVWESFLVLHRFHYVLIPGKRIFIKLFYLFSQVRLHFFGWCYWRLLYRWYKSQKQEWNRNSMHHSLVSSVFLVSNKHDCILC